ncbi:CsiV family protein [Methylophaga lonarensis]|nr:CsiV family protein [Methylophaga lonarensis]
MTTATGDTKLMLLSRSLLASWLMFAGLSVAYAQQWYQVELVVFENLSPISSEASPAMPMQEAAPLTVDTRNNRIQPASREELSAVADRLRRSSGYRVHTHLAWQQPILGPRQSQAVAVTSDNNLINGQIRLRRGTYLHADLDLWFMENTGAGAWSDSGSLSSANYSGPRNPNLKESRRVRSGQLHYFDHPRFGALLKLTAVDAPDAALQSPESFSLPAE